MTGGSEERDLCEPALGGLNDQTRDVIRVLSAKLDGIWRYEGYIADSRGDEQLQRTFQQIMNDELRHIQMLKRQVQRMCQENRFD